MTEIQIVPASQDTLRELHERGKDALGNPLTVIPGGPGRPLRCCLRRSTPRDEIALISYAPVRPKAFTVHTLPYGEYGPVFVHAGIAASRDRRRSGSPLPPAQSAQSAQSQQSQQSAQSQQPPAGEQPQQPQPPAGEQPIWCGGYVDDGQFPSAWREHPQVLRSYAADGELLDGIVTQPDEDRMAIAAELLSDPGVAFVHSRTVGVGCFSFEIRRVGAGGS